MACTSGCLTEQKGSPCLKGLPNVEELSQANLNSGFFICLTSVCRRPGGRCFSSFITALMFTSLNQALQLWGFYFSTWKRGRGRGRNEDGKGRFWKNRNIPQAVLQLILNLTVPLRSKQPKWHQPWEHFPQDRLLCNSRVLVICLHEMNPSAHFALSCAETTPELGCSALQEFLAPLEAHKSQHWLELLDETQLELNLCQSIFSFPPHLPSLPSQPFSTTVHLILPSKCSASTRYPKLWQICLGRAVFAPFSTSGKPCAFKKVEGFSINHFYLKKTIDAEAFKKIQSCYMKPVTKMLLTWPFISCSLREKVV